MPLSLSQIASQDEDVLRVLESGSSHVDAARELEHRFAIGTTESSVRRARKTLNVTQEPPNIPEIPRDTDREGVYLILPDFQCDLQDDSFLWRAYDLARDLKPKRIYHVGDENDATTVGRWVRGMPEEFEPDELQRQVDVTYKWMKRFRDIPSVESFEVAYSNHGHRFGQSLKSRVPGWKDMRVVQYDHIMREAAWHHGDEPLDIEFDVPLITSIPGVVLGHGDQWGLTSKSQYSQMSMVASHSCKSVIAGHTHRPMLATVAYKDEDFIQKSRFIMNVGNAMDVSKAEYMNVDRGKTPEWGQAVGVVTVIDGAPFPELVVDMGGKMLFRGAQY